MSFNRELLERIKLYTHRKSGEAIDDETAALYLDAFADLYEAFIELTKNNDENN